MECRGVGKLPVLVSAVQVAGFAVLDRLFESSAAASGVETRSLSPLPDPVLLLPRRSVAARPMTRKPAAVRAE